MDADEILTRLDTILEIIWYSICIGLFMKKLLPYLKIVPWRMIFSATKSTALVFGGFYLVLFGLGGGYFISEHMNPNPDSILVHTFPDTFYLWKPIAVTLFLGIFLFMGGLEIIVGCIRFSKITGICRKRAERTAVLINKARILKPNVI